jgi:hypothetical protein
VRRPVGSVLGAVLISGLAASAGAAWAECDPARQTEPVASRFEAHGDTVYDKKTGLSWMRCSYGQQWSDADGCSGAAALLDWDTAMGLHPEGAAWRLPDRDNTVDPVLDQHTKQSVLRLDRLFPHGHADLDLSEVDAVCRATGA